MPHATYFTILLSSALAFFILGGACHQAVRRRLGIPDGKLSDSMLRVCEGSLDGSTRLLMVTSRALILVTFALLLFSAAAALESPAKRIEFKMHEVYIPESKGAVMSASGTTYTGQVIPAHMAMAKAYYAVDHWLTRPDIRREVFPRGPERFVHRDEDGMMREVSESYARGGVQNVD